MQGARRRCRWCCRKSGNESHDFPFSNEEVRHLCEAVCLISSPPRSFDIFDGFDFFDLDISSSGITPLENSVTYGPAGLVCALHQLEWQEGMLKISLIDSPRQRRLVVEGKLIAPWAAELRNACQEASADLRDRELVIEMKHVTTIGQEAENVIVDLLNRGIKFRCNGVFTKHVLKQLTRRANRNLGEMKR